ncbi:hypothetical protein ABE137_06850 [Brevibacillus laterosporus]|uniref:hypothetical protein n=1 Tax=Brevibacillus laterosporus TaxID=1465 RepID=UPI003D245E67
MKEAIKVTQSFEASYQSDPTEILAWISNQLEKKTNEIYTVTISIQENVNEE